MHLLIKNCILNGQMRDILIKDGLISKIDKSINTNTENILDAKGNYIIPSLKNGHTHAAMSPLRGFGDDMKLQPWLEEKIWPAESKITSTDVYWGTRFAALEMIKSGTTFCNDMYFHFPAAQKAFIDAGIKSAAGPALFDFFDTGKVEEMKKNCLNEIENTQISGTNSLILAAHSIYTLSFESLKWIAELAGTKNIPVHIHLSETELEVKECIARYGVRPAMLLEQTGLLETEIVTAHSVWMDDNELDLLARYNVTVTYNPSSNMKLAVGKVFPYREIKERNIKILLGTDSCASNNNLDMFEEMKFASLLQKHQNNNPELLTAMEIFDIAAGSEASVFPQISSQIKVGAYADCLLLNKENLDLIPSNNLVSNIVYSANGNCVDTVICRGKLLMENRVVKDEEEILNQIRSISKRVTM